MQLETIRRKLAQVNLSHLAIVSGIGLRTLRRIKNGHTSATMKTAETLAPYLKRVR